MASTYSPGEVVPWHFAPGPIVGSYFASLTGTILCVELLHRKRLGKSIASRIQLLLCALSMGLIGIWCMHFIGNRSIILGDGSAQLQLRYSSGYTILSCVLPVIGLTFAFYIAELRIQNIILRRFLDVFTGFLAGTSIVGMHYCGNVGTTNYTLHYPTRFIAAAAIIAIGDCIIALMLFFYFKERWINVLWKRLCIAGLLSVAVCGMHYTASVGCTYRLTTLSAGGASRNVPFIVAGVLCSAAAIVTIFILFYTNLRNKNLADRAQQVNVACAYFDETGNIMVSNEGFLPSQKIAKRFNLQTFDDDFTTGHPVFHWIWKASNDWSSVKDLIPRMRSHLRRHGTLTRTNTRPGTSSSTESSRSYDEDSLQDPTLLFREGFCVATSDLADRLTISIENIGTLFDRIIGTGVVAPTSAAAKKMSQSDAASISSYSTSHLERGQLLFFTRRLSNEDVERFAAAGYRFAPPNRVEAMIARTMQLPIASVAGHIKSLHDYATNATAATLLKQGSYLTCFAALGRINRHFDVLVANARRDQLPDMQLTPQHLNASQLQFLKQYDGWSAGRMVSDLKQKRAREQQIQSEERGFVLLLINSLSSLSHQISEEWFIDLVFNAKPIVASYNNGVSGANSAPVMIFGLTKLLDIHQGMVRQPDRLAFVPLDFYRVRTSFYAGSSEVAKFRSTVHAEFAPILNRTQKEVELEKSTPHFNVPPLAAKRGFFGRKASMGVKDDEESLKEDSSSERGILAVHADEVYSGIQTVSKKQMWGGILATTDTVIVETTHKSANDIEMKSMQPKVTATAVLDKSDNRTFADLLYAQAKFRGVTKPGDNRYMAN
ncbi:hypothetical protein MBLNU457_g0295t1 [Dothideomycetes sp. NU457]